MGWGGVGWGGMGGLQTPSATIPRWALLRPHIKCNNSEQAHLRPHIKCNNSEQALLRPRIKCNNSKQTPATPKIKPKKARAQPAFFQPGVAAQRLQMTPLCRRAHYPMERQPIGPMRLRRIPRPVYSASPSFIADQNLRTRPKPARPQSLRVVLHELGNLHRRRWPLNLTLGRTINEKLVVCLDRLDVNHH